MRYFNPRSWIQRAENRLGYRIVKIRYTGDVPFDMEKEFEEIYEQAQHQTQTNVSNMYSLYSATRYVVENNIEGDIVECGVWKGGSMMVAALTLVGLGNTSRSLWLYDTYEGMSEPGPEDIQSFDGLQASRKWRQEQRVASNAWNNAPLVEVKANLYATNYPPERLFFIKGKVEETIPDRAPSGIAILRLDTDWYSSTYHELYHLFPRLANKGVLIIDDYGWWRGCKEASDKYFEDTSSVVLLNRIDEGARIAVKTQ